MATIAWDQVGERGFQAGVDRGVLYLPDGSGVPWNGLISVTEAFNRESKSFYQEGIKYLECYALGEYAADLRAFTYPEEFDQILGNVLDDGLFFHDQPPQSFGLTYRTRLGNDVDGVDLGYKIHILWNLRAVPSNIPYATSDSNVIPVVFGWSITGTPVVLAGRRPTCHVSIDSTQISAYDLGLIEDMLYGTDTTSPTFPSLDELIALDDLIITDNGDGTWTANGPDRFFTMLDATTFQLNDVDATYLDANTYTVSSTFT